jgi:hypothetical protein
MQTHHEMEIHLTNGQHLFFRLQVKTQQQTLTKYQTEHLIQMHFYGLTQVTGVHHLCKKSAQAMHHNIDLEIGLVILV